MLCTALSGIRTMILPKPVALAPDKASQMANSLVVVLSVGLKLQLHQPKACLIKVSQHFSGTKEFSATHFTTTYLITSHHIIEI